MNAGKLLALLGFTGLRVRRGDSKFFVSFLSFVVNFTRFMQEERQTPDMRAQMTDIERLRHSTAHVRASCHSERSAAQSRNLSLYV